MKNPNWGGKRAGSGRPKRLPADTLGEERKNRTFYATSREQQFIKDMLQLFRGQRDFKDFERSKSFAEVIDFMRNIQLDNISTNQVVVEKRTTKQVKKRTTKKKEEELADWAESAVAAVSKK